MAFLEGHNMKIENAIIFPSTLEKIGWNILDASLGFVVLVKSWKAKKLLRNVVTFCVTPSLFRKLHNFLGNQQQASKKSTINALQCNSKILD